VFSADIGFFLKSNKDIISSDAIKNLLQKLFGSL